MVAELAEFDLKITNLPNKAVYISVFLKKSVCCFGSYVIGQLEAALNFQIKAKVADGYYFCAPSPSMVCVLGKEKYL